MGRRREVRFINQREIAREYEGMKTRNILRWVQQGVFPSPIKVVGVTRLFDREEVERFFRARGLGGTASAQDSFETSEASEVLSQ